MSQVILRVACDGQITVGNVKVPVVETFYLGSKDEALCSSADGQSLPFSVVQVVSCPAGNQN